MLVKLKDIATYINGKAFKPSEWEDSGLPIIRIQNLNNSAKEYNYYNKEIDEKYVIESGDILISWSASLDIFEWKSEKAVLNQHIFKVIFDKGIEVDKNYFKLVISNTLHILEKYTHGSTMKHIVKKDFENIEIPLPSLTKQKEIAQTMDKASELIALRKATILKLDELAQSIFIDMFGDPVSNPKKWDIKEIRDLILEAKYGTSEKSSEEIKEYAVLRMNNLTYSGCLDLTSLKYMDLEEKEREKYLVKKGDLLFNRTNSKELVGKTAVYNREEPMAFAGYLIRVRCEDLATNVYISAFLNSKVGKKLLTNEPLANLQIHPLI